MMMTNIMTSDLSDDKDEGNDDAADIHINVLSDDNESDVQLVKEQGEVKRSCSGCMIKPYDWSKKSKRK